MTIQNVALTLLVITASVYVAYYIACVSINNNNNNDNNNNNNSTILTTKAVKDTILLITKGFSVLFIGGSVCCILSVACIWHDGKC